MLSVSKRLTSFPLKQIASRNLMKPVLASRFLSTVPSAEPTELKETKFDTISLYENTFTSTGKNIFDVRTGAYVPLQKTDLDLFPEGLAGEALAEFDFITKPTWMIRDSTKLVCRMLDDFLDRKESTAVTVPKGIARNVYFPELTDRAEWDRCKLKVSSYGKELVSDYSLDPKAATVPTMGEGSLVEHVMDKLKSSDKEIPSKIILTGDRGVGKSFVMNQAVLHARKNGWLVLFIPSGWEHSQGGVYIDPVKSSTSLPQLYDNVLMSVDALRGFWRAHADKLRQIPLKGKDYFSKFKESQAVFSEEWERVASMPGREKMKFIDLRAIIEGELNDAQEDANDADVLARFDYRRFKPETLEDLLIFGVAFRMHAGEVFTDLVNELKQVDQFPVLIAVDQYNAWEVNSAYYYGDRVHSKDLCVPRALRMLPDLHNVKNPTPVEFELKNGMCLMSTSLKHVENLKVKLDNAHQHAPLAIRIPAYNQVEFAGAMCHYVYHQIVGNMHLGNLLTYRMLTASNPRLARVDIVSHFFPKEAVEAMSEFNQGATEAEQSRIDDNQLMQAKRDLMDSKGYEEDDVDIIMDTNNPKLNTRIAHPSPRKLEADFGPNYKSKYPKDVLDAYHRRFEGGVDNARVGGMGPDPTGHDGHNPKEYDETFDADEREEEEEEEEDDLDGSKYGYVDDEAEERSVRGGRQQQQSFQERLRNKVTPQDERNVDALLRKFKESRK